MTLAHHPIGALSRGCMLMGCGDCTLAVWLSATGYLSEISTVFLNIRWFQHRWLRQHSIWYTINMILVLVTYPLARVIIPVPFILAGSLWPRWAEQHSICSVQWLAKEVLFVHFGESWSASCTHAQTMRRQKRLRRPRSLTVLVQQSIGWRSKA
ncbi:unnamed protein product [Polarella glacialis]|uniref:Uncharacterized protein n=1 Tax=Polarella glacialis TaxID=89957 RepID=A0A813FCQ3_POLGL|nr:unnamed protein product [Polarella glacialis]